MEQSTWQAKLIQILDEERRRPSLSYQVEGAGSLAAFSPLVLRAERDRHPRPVNENPHSFKFKSTNYELLAALFSQAPTAATAPLHEVFRDRILNPRSFAQTRSASTFPQWQHLASELPLIIEFSVRQGYKQELFETLPNCAATVGVLLLLLELQEIIAFNFDVFSDEELARLPELLTNIQKGARMQYGALRAKRTATPTIVNGVKINTLQLTSDIEEACSAIEEQCRQARYWYLKANLQQGLNLEVNQDKAAVDDFLQKLGFDSQLAESLRVAENLYRSASPFDLKSSMGHLRSFLENLQAEVAIRVHKIQRGTLQPGWGSSTAYLRQTSTLSVAEEKLAVGIYALISDEAVHPLIAEREYARVLRNMTIEYGLLLLTKLDKLGA